MSNKPAYVYILRCRDGSLYTGWSFDPLARLQAHAEGKGSKYTRARCPVQLVYAERLFDKREAMRRECAIKRLSRRAKLELIAGYDPGLPAGADYNITPYL